MSAGERRLWHQIKQRAGALTPELQRAIEQSFNVVRDSLTAAEMAKLVAGARSEAFVTALFLFCSIPASIATAAAPTSWPAWGARTLRCSCPTPHWLKP